MQQIEILSDSKIINELPTAIEMDIFAKNYTKEQWLKLIDNKEFLEIFTWDLRICKELADKILNPIVENPS